MFQPYIEKADKQCVYPPSLSVFKNLSNLFLQLFILLKGIPYRPGNGSGQQQQNKQRAYRCNLGCHNVVVRFEAEYNLMFAGRYAKGA